jgi:hypothetical protein
MGNLLECHGLRFRAIICGDTCEGKIVVYDNGIYLCQNTHPGNTPSGDMFGYKYSWMYQQFKNDHSTDWIADDVTELEIVEQIQPEALLTIREVALARAKSIFSDDDFIDVYINAFEEGSKHQKEKS